MWGGGLWGRWKKGGGLGWGGGLKLWVEEKNWEGGGGGVGGDGGGDGDWDGCDVGGGNYDGG